MPAIENDRWERYAINRAKGMTCGEAYIGAGFETKSYENAGKAGSKLEQKDEIKLRIRELQGKHAKEIGVTVNSLLKELDAMYRLARRSKQPAAGVGAIMGKARLLGLVVDRAEVESTVRRPMREPSEIKQMSLEEWQDKFAPKMLDPKPDGGTHAVSAARAKLGGRKS